MIKKITLDKLKEARDLRARLKIVIELGKIPPAADPREVLGRDGKAELHRK